uniref:Protein wos2 n=1 Tax=Schistocephalus solidus TaxID=70667 RepID=A0A0X3NYH7_SCHSO
MSGDAVPVFCTPTVLWAQDRDSIFVTVDLGDVQNKEVTITPEKFVFSGKAGSPKVHDYAVTLEFSEQVDADKAKDISTDRVITYRIPKKEAKPWTHFLKNKSKPHWLKVDFAHWVDVDDSDSEAEGFGGDGRNFQDMLSMMGNNKDFEDDENDADVDSDDEDLPDLDEPTKVANGDAAPVVESSDASAKDAAPVAKPMDAPAKDADSAEAKSKGAPTNETAPVAAAEA